MFYTIIARFILVFLLFTLNAYSQEPLSNATQVEVAQLAETFLQQTNTPGLSIAVRKDGKMLYAKGFGFANLEEKIKMDPTIRLRTASVAKVITATALGRLVSEGKLDFDAPITKYVPYIQKSYAQLTTRQLAGHTSGLAHKPKGTKYEKKQFDNIKETVALMQRPLLFEPDTDYKYSTYAFNLLAAVIEGASGEKYMDYMNEAVFKPLGMLHTFPENIETLTNKDAQVYQLKKGQLSKDKLTNASYKLPGAGFRSTPTDLVKMMDAYATGFISKDIIKDMFNSHQLKNGKKTNVGIVWRSSVDTFNNMVIEHAGNWRGARTVVVYYPKDNLSISLMINARCPVLIEETAHLFAHIIRNNTKVKVTLENTRTAVVLTQITKKGKETYEGLLSFKGTEGLLKTNSKGFLKSNPLISLGSENNYALATPYGLLYVDLKNTDSLEGAIFSYYTRLDTNPILGTPLATFKN